MNLLLIAVLAVLIIKLRSGYKRGMVKEVIMLVSLMILCITVALITNAMKSYRQGQIFNAVLMALMLTILGAVQFALKPIFFSAKLVVKLPIVSWADKMLGISCRNSGDDTASVDAGFLCHDYGHGWNQ